VKQDKPHLRSNSDIHRNSHKQSLSLQEVSKNNDDDDDICAPLIDQARVNDRVLEVHKLQENDSFSSSSDDFSVASVSDKPGLKRSESYDSIAENAGRDSIFITNNLQTWNDNEILRPFVETLTPGAGLQCLSLLLLNHLLHSGSGYDARIRHAIKKLAIVLITSEIKNNEDYDHRFHDKVLIQHATRKFEALEHSVAVKLLLLSGADSVREQSKGQIVRSQRGDLTKQAVIRGLKIGSAGIIAGALFAVTGGIGKLLILSRLTYSYQIIPHSFISCSKHCGCCPSYWRNSCHCCCNFDQYSSSYNIRCRRRWACSL
jgi:hypothetical protein